MTRHLTATTMICATIALISHAYAVPFSLNAGDTVLINETLNTTDPNENGEGEPLVITANGQSIGVVFNYAIPASITYVAPTTGVVDFSSFIRGADGDESASGTATLNPSSPISSSTKSAFALSAAAFGTVSGAFWTIDFFCGAATAGICALAGTPVAALSSLVAGGLALVAADPVDMNFMTIATPQTVPLPGNLGIAASLANDEAKAIAITSALLTSINRYQGAVAAGDLFWQQQQLSAIQDYQSQLETLLQNIPQDLRDIIKQYVASGMSSIRFTSSQVLAAETQLAQFGLPQDIINLLTQFDLTNTFDISAITQNIFVQDINVLSGLYPDILSEFADAIAGVSAVPEPSSLVLIVFGAVGVLYIRRREIYAHTMIANRCPESASAAA
jgi:hypothetical protein